MEKIDYLQILESLSVFHRLPAKKQTMLKNAPASLWPEKLHLLSDAEATLISVQEQYADNLLATPAAFSATVRQSISRVTENLEKEKQVRDLSSLNL